MRVKDILTPHVHTITQDIPAEEAWHRMTLHGVHHLVVVEGHEVIGIISERDLGGPCGGRVCEGHLVGDLMSHHILSAHPDTPIKDVANMLRGYNIGCLPVFENHQLVGIVTVSDLLELIGKGFDKASVPKERGSSVNMPAYTRSSQMTH